MAPIICMIATTLVTTLIACKGNDSGGDGGGESGGPGMVDCDDCPGTLAWNCSCVNPQATSETIWQWGECGGTGNFNTCEQSCQGVWALYGGCPTPTLENCYVLPNNTCSTNPDSGTCSGWAPASHISLVSGVRYMDYDWFESVIDNAAPLWTCDDAYLNPRSTTGFTVNQASSGEMLYVLGLRNNDIPLTLNGMELDNYWEGFSAFYKLWIYDAETSYHLTVRRGTSTLHFYYVLTP